MSDQFQPNASFIRPEGTGESTATPQYYAQAPQPAAEQPRKAHSHEDRVRALVDFAAKKHAENVFEVECPDMTQRLRVMFGPDEPPFTVKFRPMKLDEMIAIGALPNTLVNKIDDFNTSIAVFQFENERGEDETSEQFNRRSIANTIRQQGILSFQQRTAETRDATVVACTVDPKILLSELERTPGAVEMVLTDLTEKDRSVIYRAIQKHTGEMTEEELKSLVESENPAASDSATVAEEPKPASDSNGSGETQ